jgi:hypothetical protein
VLREMRLGAHLRSERAEEDETAFKIIEVCVCEFLYMRFSLTRVMNGDEWRVSGFD